MKQIKVKASVKLPDGRKKARMSAPEKFFVSFGAIGAKLIKNLKSFRKKKRKSFKTMFSVLLASASMAAVMSVYNVIFSATERDGRSDTVTQTAYGEIGLPPEENAPEQLFANADISEADGDLPVTENGARHAP